MKSHWVEHKGKRVFIADFSDFAMSYAALRHEADEIIAALQQEPLGTVRSISNVTGTAGVSENVAILRDIVTHTNKHILKRCVVGVEGLRWYILRRFNELTGAAKFEAFRSVEEALDWIVKD